MNSVRVIADHKSSIASVSQIELVVVINSFNRVQLLRESITSINKALNLAFPNNSAIIVFEAGSTDGSQEFLEEFIQQNQDRDIISIQPNPGIDSSFSSGCNLAIQIAAARFPQLKWSGIRYKCAFNSYTIFGEIWYNKDYDIPHLPIRKGDIVVDIGANQGCFSCYVAYQGAHVFAFEPSPENFQVLVDNLEANKLLQHVVVKPWAISSYNGIAELIYISEGGGGLHTTKSEIASSLQKIGMNIISKRQVNCFSLPQIIESFEIQKIRLCKLDCEGSELDILKQLEMIHLSKIDAFVLEYHAAYPLEELLKLILSWKTHQVSFAEDNDHCSKHILRVVSNQVLIDNKSSFV